MTGITDNRSIVLFDGVCVLCSKTVRFIIRYDRKDFFRFAPLQSEAATRLLEKHQPVNDIYNSVILLENDKIYTRSEAVLRIFKKLNGLWPVLWIFIIVPAPVRDFFYKFAAVKRYGWFGKYNKCMIPEKGIAYKFLDQTI